ncbi:MAG: oligopeptide transport system substrate-binding protein [Halioglobus sp.]|jgi:oligopeptide transport system substrate-binding protein
MTVYPTTAHITALRRILFSLPLLLLVLLAACSEPPWNNPHPPSSPGQSTYWSMMTPAPPKHLDPAISYASDESLFTLQIYEPPMAYHFLKRPYELIPGALQSFPTVTFLDEKGEVVQEGADTIAFSRYTLHLRDDLHFQPHPAFAKDESGRPLYLFNSAQEGARFRQIPDFPQLGDRSVKANDYAYAIRRLADPEIGSPMLGLMSQHIVGMTAFSESLANMPREGWLDLDQYPFDGLNVVDELTLQITINDRYPQFIYWLAMPFFSPIPPEADRFYSNPGFADRNLTLDWWPVGSGPFLMAKNDPNSEIVLERNPNFRDDFFPAEGAPGDLEAGRLQDAGKKIPFIDRAVYRLEKESLSLWTKFLQGYYDRSGEVHAHTTGVFDRAFVVGPDGVEMSGELQDHGISMSPDVKPALYYYGFNMRDPVVGGYTEDKRKLRQALQIAFLTEEYLSVFYKGNGVVGHNPIPPGIPGYLEGEAGINPYVYDWVGGEPKRKTIAYAKQLLVEAGYPNGRDARTGEPLKIFIDVQSQAISKTSMNWIVRVFSAIGVQVEFRPADWNRTREKLLTGNTQIFSHGWLADYPDPENFLFLLYGPESPLICKCDGANNSNYESEEYDDLFRQMRVLPPSPQRQKMVARMVELYRRDAVWLNVFYPKEIFLNNTWVYNTKRHGISKATLKYVRIDDEERERRQIQWNQPVVWPLYALGILIVMLVLPGVLAYRRRQKETVEPGEA